MQRSSKERERQRRRCSARQRRASSSDGVARPREEYGTVGRRCRGCWRSDGKTREVPTVGSSVTSSCFGCRCFDVPASQHACPPCLPPNQTRQPPPDVAGAMRRRPGVYRPGQGRDCPAAQSNPTLLDRRADHVQSMLPPPRAALLALRLGPRSCSCVAFPLLPTTRAARTMSTKPSLKAAEDFLSFVDASPTRMLSTTARFHGKTFALTFFKLSTLSSSPRTA